MRKLWYVKKVKCEGYFDQSKDCDSGNIFKTAFLLNSLTAFPFPALSFRSFQGEEQGMETRMCELEQHGFICKDRCQTSL